VFCLAEQGPPRAREFPTVVRAFMACCIILWPVQASKFREMYLESCNDCDTEFIRVPIGQGKTGKSRGICVVRERPGKNIVLKVRENDLGSCRLQITVIFCIYKYWKAGKFVTSIERLKARSVSASGGKGPLTLRPVPLSFGYRSINTVLLPYDVVYRYHFWHLCTRVR